MPVLRYHCSKCNHEFELVRPKNKASEYMPCPKCGHEASPRSSFQETSLAGHLAAAPTPSGRRELPPWTRGQVEAQVRQMVTGGDAVGGQEVELVTQEVLREFSHSDLEITPGNIKTLAQKHLAGLDSWARTARRSGAHLDEASKLDDED